MPSRPLVLTTGEYYHVYNRGVNRIPTFSTPFELQRAIMYLWYYQYSKRTLGLAHFLELSFDVQAQTRMQIEKTDALVEIHAYCLMPNHYHLLLKQKKKNGISTFMGNFQNGYTKFYNARNRRSGPLFGGRFKAVHVESQEQLLHLSRYIHLNPITSFIVKKPTQLYTYPWSSLPEYLNQVTENRYTITTKTLIEAQFQNSEDHKKFITDQIDYQRDLAAIKHLTLEET